MKVRQCVILVGGLGTRLGQLTATCPKPLLPVGDRPFLDFLLWHIWRFGFDEVLLLAGHQAGQVLEYVKSTPYASKLGLKVSIEPAPLGTAGALRHALPLLEENFLLLNGDSVFDFNWLDLVDLLSGDANALAAMSLRPMSDALRFGVVDLEGETVRGFRERGTSTGGLVNGGVYLIRRPLVSLIAPNGSLEATVLPQLASQGLVRGRVYRGFFLDIGVPEAYERAGDLVTASLRRPAFFLDRDGVLNVDKGHVGELSRFEWIPGAREAVKAINDAGYFAFVVTNQAGVAKGFYTEAAIQVLHGHMQDQLRSIGAHIDAFRYCPTHPDGSVPEYRKASSWRKPEPGMITDLMLHWPVEGPSSHLIGDKPSDLQAGEAAGIRSHCFKGGSLHHFLQSLPNTGIEIPRHSQPCP